MTYRQIQEAGRRAALGVLREEYENVPAWDGWEDRLPGKIAKAVLDAAKLASVAPEKPLIRYAGYEPRKGSRKPDRLAPNSVDGEGS